MSEEGEFKRRFQKKRQTLKDTVIVAMSIDKDCAVDFVGLNEAEKWIEEAKKEFLALIPEDVWKRLEQGTRPEALTYGPLAVTVRKWFGK